MREFIPITVELIEAYRLNRVSLKFMVIETIAIRGVFEGVYNCFVSDKEIQPLENLEVSEKNRIWLMASNCEPTRSQKDKISSCKCIHLIEQMLNTKITKL